MRQFVTSLVPIRRIPGIVTALSISYFAILGFVCVQKYLEFGYNDFDLAVHAQSVWSICRAKFDSSILGIPFLGNHMVLLLFLIAPLYALFPSPVTLLILQTAILAAGAWAVFLIARTELSERWGLAFAAIYLIYPPLFLMNLYEFHPVALATTFILYAWYFYRAKLFTPFLAFIILAMLCQENISMITAMFGIYAWLKGQRNRWTRIPLCIGTAYFIIVAGLIMPKLNPYIQFYRIYANLGSNLPEIARNMIMHPMRVAGTMCNPIRLQFFNLLLAPLGYLSLLSPLTMLPAAPVFLQRLLSERATESAIIYHYQAEFIPFLFPAAILGIRRVLEHRSSTIPRLLAVVLISVFPPLSLLLTLTIVPRIMPHAERAPDVIELQRRVVQAIQPDRSVAATFEFLAPLSHRERLYSLHHIYMGRYTLSTIPYPAPADLDVILINTDDHLTFHTRAFYAPDNYLRLQKLLEGKGWKLSAHLDPFVAFERSDADPDHIPFPTLVTIPEHVPSFRGRVVQEGTSPVLLRGFSLAPKDPDDATDVTLYWEKTAADAPEFTAVCVLKGRNGTISRVRLAPGSRIWPPQSWPVGRIVADRHRIRLAVAAPDDDEMEMQVSVEPLF